MKRPLAAIVAALVACVAVAQAQEAYTIKLKERAQGQSAQVKRNETTGSKVQVKMGDNVLVDQRENKTMVQEYTETVVKGETGKAPIKVERAYTKATTGKDGKNEDAGLAGKTVVIEKKGDVYEFTYKDGGKLEGAAAALLTKDFGKKSDDNKELEKLLLPTGSIKVGDTWKIEMSKIAKTIGKEGLELDAAKSSGTGKFLKAYKKDGKQYGELKFTMEMPLKSVGKGKGELKFTGGAKVVLEGTLDACIDGTAETGTLKMNMKMSGTANVAGADGVTAMLDVNADMIQSQTEAAKKK